MKCNTERLIEALIAVEMMKLQKQQTAEEGPQARPKTTMVTISRDFGSMGREVAMLLADVLEVRCCDRGILQEVARRAHVDEKLARALDERVQNLGEQLWRKLLNKEALAAETYHEHLVKTILSLTCTGGVIIGRGSNLILGSQRAFRVRIAGSDDKCAMRVAKRERLPFERALQRVHEVNRERQEYVKKVYKTDICDHASYDLVLNSDRYDLVQLVELILEAMEKAGYQLPGDAMQSVSLLARENRPVWMAAADSDPGCGCDTPG